MRNARTSSPSLLRSRSRHASGESDGTPVCIRATAIPSASATPSLVDGTRNAASSSCITARSRWKEPIRASSARSRNTIVLVMAIPLCLFLAAFILVLCYVGDVHIDMGRMILVPESDQDLQAFFAMVGAAQVRNVVGECDMAIVNRLPHE